MEADLGSCPWVTGPGAAALSSPLAEGEAGVQVTAGSQAAARHAGLASDGWVWMWPCHTPAPRCTSDPHSLICKREVRYLPQGVGLERVRMVKCSGNASHHYPGSKGPPSPGAVLPLAAWGETDRRIVREDSALGRGALGSLSPDVDSGAGGGRRLQAEAGHRWAASDPPRRQPGTCAGQHSHDWAVLPPEPFIPPGGLQMVTEGAPRSLPTSPLQRSQSPKLQGPGAPREGEAQGHAGEGPTLNRIKTARRMGGE